MEQKPQDPHSPSNADQADQANSPSPEEPAQTVAPAPQSEPATTVAAAAATESPQPQQKPQGAGAALTISVVALLLGVGSLVFGGWMWQQGQLERESSAALGAEVSNLKQQLQQKGGELSATLEQLRQVQLGNQQAIGKVQAGFAQAEQTILAEQQKLKQLAPQSWLLAEASYLVQMAERKLVLEQDAATAIKLLQDADSRLALLGNPDLKPLRQALQNDLAMVQGLPQFDRDGVAMAIEALVREVDRLPLNRVQLPEVAEQPQSTELSDQINDWQANLSRSWQALMEDFITVRRRSEQVQPLLAPAQEWYLREHMRGKLLQAQLALYHGDQQALRQSLQTAQQWLQNYFDLDTSQVQAALARLQRWQAADMAQLKAVQFESLAGLKQAADDKLLREAP
ncbi:uroporphyrinogen-III C-methyltransferase [Ferrimonas senticii]|uniref:uroporphyrinogen-III C-methyltransferase n=1 Tax=Ferrimonas senticii TaxID=394566 RepID=UPI00040577AB|nr:uroporphyrinogen-III C-methyltransferase [Ferrimonas senticii]